MPKDIEVFKVIVRMPKDIEVFKVIDFDEKKVVNFCFQHEPRVYLSYHLCSLPVSRDIVIQYASNQRTRIKENKRSGVKSEHGLKSCIRPAPSSISAQLSKPRKMKYKQTCMKYAESKELIGYDHEIKIEDK
ncbi:hypothetical protein RND71_012541 [Anisodus tanguticus]|uniref:Uncharacterized protein n=1 Tax=Anisodus tanguticus TaxID=243964 RepID=A0AAE1SFV1_9SOLA|nr:hypothetical protein RND71_012541 [Anisodus tanguticus]